MSTIRTHRNLNPGRIPSGLAGTPWGLEDPAIIQQERRRKIRKKRRQRRKQKQLLLSMIAMNTNNNKDDDDDDENYDDNDDDDDNICCCCWYNKWCQYLAQLITILVVMIVILTSITTIFSYLYNRSIYNLPWWSVTQLSNPNRFIPLNSPETTGGIDPRSYVRVMTTCPRLDRGSPSDLPFQNNTNGTLSVHLVVSTFHENTQWIYDNFAHRYPIILLTRDNPDNPNNVAPNVGFEALPLIRYINLHYDNLPDRIIYMHGDRHPWHILGGDMVPIIASIDTSLHWVNYNLNMYFNIDRFRSGLDSRHYEEIERVWKVAKLEQFLGPMPDRFAAYCCAQFLVSRSQIQRRSKAFWNHVDQWLSSGDYDGINGKTVAVAFEHIWAYLFTGLQEEPRIQHPCEIFDCSIYKGPKKITRCCTPLGLPPLCP